MSTTILHILSEFAYILVFFTFFFSLAIFFGRQMLINTICGLLISLLLVKEFPYYKILFKGLQNQTVILAVKIIFFLIITVLVTLLFRKLMPPEFSENKFKNIGKKFLLSFGATILVMIFSFNAVSVSEIFTIGTPVQALFSSPDLYFGWLLVPLLILVFS